MNLRLSQNKMFKTQKKKSSVLLMIIVRGLKTRAWGEKCLNLKCMFTWNVHYMDSQNHSIRILSAQRFYSLGPQCCYGYLVTVALISSSSFCTRILKSWFKMMGRKLMMEWILSTFNKFCSELMGKTQMNKQEVVQHSLQVFSGLWCDHMITVASLYLTTRFPSLLWQKV